MIHPNMDGKDLLTKTNILLLSFIMDYYIHDRRSYAFYYGIYPIILSVMKPIMAYSYMQ